MSFTPTVNYGQVYTNNLNGVLASHAYYISVEILNPSTQQTVTLTDGGGRIYMPFNRCETFMRKSVIKHPTQDSNTRTFIWVTANTGYSEWTEVKARNLMWIDLTKMFGSDANIISALGLPSGTNITNPEVITAFERLFPQEYYAHRTQPPKSNPNPFGIFPQ